MKTKIINPLRVRFTITVKIKVTILNHRLIQQSQTLRMGCVWGPQACTNSTQRLDMSRADDVLSEGDVLPDLGQGTSKILDSQ